jgi:hypothetical protein
MCYPNFWISGIGNLYLVVGIGNSWSTAGRGGVDPKSSKVWTMPLAVAGNVYLDAGLNGSFYSGNSRIW